MGNPRHAARRRSIPVLPLEEKGDSLYALAYSWMSILSGSLSYLNLANILAWPGVPVGCTRQRNCLVTSNRAVRAPRRASVYRHEKLSRLDLGGGECLHDLLGKRGWGVW